MVKELYYTMLDALADAAEWTGQVIVGLLWGCAFAAMQLVRMFICALLVLGEIVLGMILVPLAVLGFLVTLFFGFLIDAPHFPKWGMLAMSTGCLVLYWLYLGLMSLFMSLPGHANRDR